jgi:hypothetical protein
MYIALYFFFTQLVGLALGSAVGGWLLDNVMYRVEAYHLVVLGTPISRYNVLFLLSGSCASSPYCSCCPASMRRARPTPGWSPAT